MLPPRPREQPGGPPEQLGHQLARRHALGQGVAVAAVGAEDHVVRAQVGAHAGRDRLLADVGVAGAVDQAACVGPGQRLLGPPDHDHLAVERRAPARASSSGIVSLSVAIEVLSAGPASGVRGPELAAARVEREVAAVDRAGCGR